MLISQILSELQLPYILKYLTVYILFDFFDEKMPDTRFGKSKVDQGEQNSELIEIITSVTEIKTLIQLEEEKLVKKQKEGFDMTVWKLQERITTLEYKSQSQN